MWPKCPWSKSGWVIPNRTCTLSLLPFACTLFVHGGWPPCNLAVRRATLQQLYRQGRPPLSCCCVVLCLLELATPCVQPSTSCRCMLLCVRELLRGLTVWNLPRAAASSCWPSPSLLLPQWALPSPSCCTGPCSPKSKELQICGYVYFLKLWTSDLSFWVLLNILISAPPNDLKFSQKFTVFSNCFNVSCIISILGQIWPKNRPEMICF